MSDTPAAGLFAPASIGAITVSNRIAMAPLPRSRAGMDGVRSPLAVDYYRQGASAGLIITEATNIRVRDAAMPTPPASTPKRRQREAPLFEAPLDAYNGGGAEGYTDFATLAG